LHRQPTGLFAFYRRMKPATCKASQRLRGRSAKAGLACACGNAAQASTIDHIDRSAKLVHAMRANPIHRL
jgi:hypothetical protein